MRQGQAARFVAGDYVPAVSIIRLDTTGSQGNAPADEDAEAAFVAALRTRAADALERAYGFLRSHAAPRTLLRAEVLCEGEPVSKLTEALSAAQQADGSLWPGDFVPGGALGFPDLPYAELSESDRKLIGTLEAMLIAGDAKALHAPWVERGARFFEANQRGDGSFFEGLETGENADSVAGRDARVFWTAMIAGILGRTPFVRHDLLDAAGDFLAARFEPEAVENDGYSALLGYSHFFTNVAHDLSDEALQWCGRALEKGFRSRQIEGVATVRVLLTCDAQAMPGATFDVAELLERVLEEQGGDGGFAELSVEGPAARTTQTFDGMLALVRLCHALEA